jgi:hypothetical protein
MATEAQIKANQENAQHSTGATTEAGSARSSQNATRHGYTGRSLVLRPEEIEDYNAHVAAYIADYEPTTVRQRQLVQQKADLDWSLHQISIEQFNTMTHMNLISSQPPNPENPLAITTQLAPFARILNTFNLYEVRRRRASKAVAEELDAIQKPVAAAAKPHKTLGKTLAPTEIGFDCSSDKKQPTAPSPEAIMDKIRKAQAEHRAEMDKIDAGRPVK